MSKPTISIIDDHEASREGLDALLSVHGYQTELFKSAEEFLENKERSSIGCVITDLQMDEINGLELLIQLQQEKTLLPVIVVSAYATVPEAVEIMRQGALTLVQKPYEECKILKAVEQALKINFQQSDEEELLIELNKKFDSLNKDEFQIMEMLASGVTKKVISLQIEISIRTIERKRESIYRKLEVDSANELTMLYVEWSQYQEKFSHH